LIWRWAAAGRVGGVRGSAEAGPGRLSVGVSVARGTVESPDILVVVADNGESIEKPSQAAERLPYHCTPKGVSPETGRSKLSKLDKQAVPHGAMQGVDPKNRGRREGRKCAS